MRTNAFGVSIGETGMRGAVPGGRREFRSRGESAMSDRANIAVVARE